MKLVAIMPVRNEEWLLGLTVRALLLWVDELVILDHCSTDGTPGILTQVASEYPGRVILLKECENTWREMSHRQRLLTAARKRKATHIVIVDADEVLSGGALPTIRDTIETLAPGQVLQLDWVHCWRSLTRRRVGGRWNGQWASMAFRDTPGLCWKTRGGYDHHHRHPFEPTGYLKSVHGGLFHLQHVVWRRLLAKQALYKMIERVRWPDRESPEQIDRKYNRTVDETELALDSVENCGWEPYAHLTHYLDLEDRVPWQETECKRLVTQHGPRQFLGLDLYGATT